MTASRRTVEDERDGLRVVGAVVDVYPALGPIDGRDDRRVHLDAVVQAGECRVAVPAAEACDYGCAPEQTTSHTHKA